MTQTTPKTAENLKDSMLLSLELGKNKWTLTFGTLGNDLRQRNVQARDLAAVDAEIAKAREKFDLPEGCAVFSCYEAGRDGFWLHRALLERGVRDQVVDSSSIKVDRRKRRMKNDGMDGRSLLKVLRRVLLGEREECRVVNVPSEEAETARHLHRELGRLKKEVTAHRNRMEALLALHGMRVKVGANFPEVLKAAKDWKGRALGGDVAAELVREHERLQFASAQVQWLKEEQKARLVAAKAAGEKADEGLKKVLGLQTIRSVADSAWPLVMEFFGWREFRNSKEVGACAGLAGTPYSSGNSERDQGISKAGNWRIRSLMVELSWCWVRYQPGSKLTQWYQERFGGGNKRTRRVGIVAVARRLLVALWKFTQTGELPEGAVLKG